MDIEFDYGHPLYVRKFSHWLRAKGLDIDTISDAARHRLEGEFRYSLVSIHGTTDPDEMDLLT